MKIRRPFVTVAATLWAVTALVGGVRAAEPQGGAGHPRPGARPTAIRTIDTIRRIDVNNINMFLTNEGYFAYDAGNVSGGGGEGLYYPRGTTKTAVFDAGPYIGCLINDTLHVTVTEYNSEWGPGYIHAGSAGPGLVAGQWAPHDSSAFFVYKMVRWTGADSTDSAHVVRTQDQLFADPTADPLVHHSWSEYMAGAAPFGAPWKTYRLPKPNSPGDSVDVPGPDVAGDMMMWSVYNDADPSLHTNAAGKSLPIGLEIQQTTWAYNRQGPLGTTVFVKYRIINKGVQTLKNAYFSQWCDPDLGGFTDDLVGCDTLLDRTGKPRSLGFCYNANNNDQLYGATPPAVGFDFFQGPKDSTGARLGMTSFNRYQNGQDPSSPDQTYFYMQGLAPDGSDVVDPYGKTTRFVDAGDPVSPGPTDWLDSNPADRRLMLSSGPWSMAPGDTQTVVVGLIIGQGNDRLSSISGLRFNDESAQKAFDDGFVLPNPPSQPRVSVSTAHGAVTMNWDRASLTSYDEPGYAFEGYNVYQGASTAGPWKRVATYDLVDKIRVIFDQVFDVSTGQIIPNFPVAFGSDDGLQYSYTATQDAVRGGPLHDGTQYYYAVTSYSYNPVGLPKVLENAQAVVRAMPQRPPGGTDPATASATAVTYLQKDPVKSPTTDQVTVSVVNPAQVTGHMYKVSFTPLSPPFTGTIGNVGPVTAYDSWSITDSTTSNVLAAGLLNRNGDGDYPIVDGIQVVEQGNYQPALATAAFVNVGTNTVPIAGAAWGLPFFGGGAGTEGGLAGFGAFPTTLNPDVVANADSFATVELRFGVQQKCYRYFRLEKNSQDAGAPGGTRGYPYGGFQTCNFQVWDTLHNRQLDAFFVERMLVDSVTFVPLPAAQQPASQDSTWDPGNDPGAGDREYLCVLATPYSDTPKTVYTQDKAPLGAPLDPGGLPITYFLGAYRPDPTVAFVAGQKFVWTWATPATSNDVFVFSTSALRQNNAALAKANLGAIRVVPNPYYAHSAYELDQFHRVMRFTNLPEQCTVKIFNLAGQLVRTLQKTDGTTSVLDWNLLTDFQLPVGSGIYVYVVDAPGVGRSVGRMAVFMEKERLNNF